MLLRSGVTYFAPSNVVVQCSTRIVWLPKTPHPGVGCSVTPDVRARPMKTGIGKIASDSNRRLVYALHELRSAACTA